MLTNDINRYQERGLMVKPLSYVEIGHEPKGFKNALSPDYVKKDIGNFENLTSTVFGYQVGEEEALKMIKYLTGFILDGIESRRKFYEKGMRNL
jgi:hypothetical protein